MRRCPYCGEKIFSDAVDCKHCGKAFATSNQVKQQRAEEAETPGLVNLHSWEGKRVPTWVMALVVGFFLLCLVLMVNEGCTKDMDRPAATSNPNPVYFSS